MTVDVDCTRAQNGYHGPVNRQGKCPWCDKILWTGSLGGEFKETRNAFVNFDPSVTTSVHVYTRN